MPPEFSACTLEIAFTDLESSLLDSGMCFHVHQSIMESGTSHGKLCSRVSCFKSIWTPIIGERLSYKQAEYLSVDALSSGACIVVVVSWPGVSALLSVMFSCRFFILLLASLMFFSFSEVLALVC